ncbi:radical SAM/SPASM domain-containing protein [Magnetospirillum gryphiswaldense]|uniref:Fe-S oxidoreductases n=1 Tax=Magnetospirillum gryphiswaldense TaxID=55518 RepID=A4U176_9PROT|nr:radical SAM protein [Magnetospirillum gryphiswaldense]AVM75586.1 molybdenum cofactor biosynthesis protein A [Magnetospirillum gryphiswaldense MSR-1]AVM79489.1 molybdenum cofactor biosynthesis protein A [Magnetospirillum gryphiswaldense]CAM76633.1 Fe-S oxidoreductases [Magnetospirillum gryphiswaldense MSR-1]
MTTTPINKGQFTLETPERAHAFECNRGAGVEADYAENRRLWTQLAQGQVVSDMPLHVDLELASVCNLRCPMCYTISDDFRKHVNATIMDGALFRRLIDECAAGGVYSIRLSFRGEAFLHPDIVELTRYAKQAGIREVSTLTNGARMDVAMFGEMMEAGLDWVTFSIDGIGKTYEEIRRPNKFDDMVAKLTAFAAIKRRAGRVKPVVKVQSILPAIEANPQEFYDIFAPISDMVSANPLIDFLQDKRALPKIPDFSCPQIYQRLVIGADGLAMMCSNDEKGEFIVGDANKQSLRAIWHGPEMMRARDVHRRHCGAAELEPCAKCYLPLEVRDETVVLDGRVVTAQKYVSGVEKVSQLNTPERWKRKGLEA